MYRSIIRLPNNGQNKVIRLLTWQSLSGYMNVLLQTSQAKNVSFAKIDQ